MVLGAELFDWSSGVQLPFCYSDFDIPIIAYLSFVE
nr:MAG TPA: hypothetical protein [Caudoviricetes sp.]